MLQGEFDRVREDHQRKIETLESSLEQSNNKHQEEVAYFQKLLKEREESDRQRESERERERQADDARAKESTEEVRRCLEAQLETLRAELGAIQEQKSHEIVELQENHQSKLTEAQQEVENLKEELAQKSLQHEEEMRALEEDFEMERERLLLLHEELTEQLALKGITTINLWEKVRIKKNRFCYSVFSVVVGKDKGPLILPLKSRHHIVILMCCVVSVVISYIVIFFTFINCKSFPQHKTLSTSSV